MYDGRGMAKLDAYLRSIEKFGAAGAVLTSNQPITLRFPSGDRNATQVTSHDQLVGMIREVASPSGLDQIDQGRPARFEIESAGFRYAISVAPRQGAWQVTIEPAGAPSAVPAPVPPSSSSGTHPRVATPPPFAVEPVDMMIERGQYGGGSAALVPATTSGSAILDQITRAARGARATDVFMGTGIAPVHRVAGELTAHGNAMDAEALSREVGIVAPAVARGAWADHRTAVFAYGDGGGRVRVTLGRDQRGPTAALRLLPDEAPALERLAIPKAGEWLGMRGLIVVTGGAGAGKSVTMAALVRVLGERQRRVITIEDPIEVVHVAPTISQRAIGEHVLSVRGGVAEALSEGADAIAIGEVTTPDAANALLDAVLGGLLVLTTIGAPSPAIALERIVALAGLDNRDLARSVLGECLIGSIRPAIARGGARTFETTSRAG